MSNLTPINWSKVKPLMLPWALVLALASNAVLGWNVLQGKLGVPSTPSAQTPVVPAYVQPPATPTVPEDVQRRLVLLETLFPRTYSGQVFFEEMLRRIVSERYLEDFSLRTPRGLRLHLYPVKVHSIALRPETLAQFTDVAIDLFDSDPNMLRGIPKSANEHDTIPEIAVRFLPEFPLTATLHAFRTSVVPGGTDGPSFTPDPCTVPDHADETIRRLAGYFRVFYGLDTPNLCRFVRQSDPLPQTFRNWWLFEDRARGAAIWNQETERSGDDAPRRVIRAYWFDWGAFTKETGAARPRRRDDREGGVARSAIAVMHEKWGEGYDGEQLATIFSITAERPEFQGLSTVEDGDFVWVDRLQQDIIQSLVVEQMCAYGCAY